MFCCNFFTILIIFLDAPCSNKHIGTRKGAQNKVLRAVDFFLIWGSGLLNNSLKEVSLGSISIVNFTFVVQLGPHSVVVCLPHVVDSVFFVEK